MTDPTRMWNRHLKRYTDPALEKSAFIIFVEFCSDMVLDAGEVATLVKQRWSLKPSIFHLSEDVALELGQAMGIDHASWQSARGADFLAGRPGKRVFVGELRYCRACLSLGNHSTLFQLPQVVHCPIHEERLRIGCPHCGHPIPCNASALARNHLYCGTCNRNVATERRRAALGGPIGHPPVECFLALRRVLSERPRAGESRSPLQWGRSPAEIASNPTLGRILYAHTLWGDPSMGKGFLRLPAESMLLDTEEGAISRTKFHALVRIAAISAFVDLAARLGRYARLYEVPQGVEDAMHSAARLDLRLSTVEAAFWRSAGAFDVLRFVVGEMPPPTAKAPPFGSWLPEHAGAMRLVVERAVQALFVHTLLSLRKLRYGVQVAWSEVPDESLFLPPWRTLARAESGRLELQVRARVSAGTVERVAKRYCRNWLVKVPHSASALELIGSPRDVDSVTAEG